MTEKEFKELKEENKRLRDVINNYRSMLGLTQPRRAVPIELVSKYPALEEFFFKPLGRKLGVKEEGRKLTDEIRRALFPETKVKRDGGTDKYITCRDMTDAQYEIYYQTLEAIVDALNEGRRKAEALKSLCEPDTGYGNRLA